MVPSLDIILHFLLVIFRLKSYCLYICLNFLNIYNIYGIKVWYVRIIDFILTSVKGKLLRSWFAPCLVHVMLIFMPTSLSGHVKKITSTHNLFIIYIYIEINFPHPFTMILRLKQYLYTIFCEISAALGLRNRGKFWKYKKLYILTRNLHSEIP